MDNHNEAVAAIAERVRQFYERKEQFRVFHGSTNSTRPPQYTRQTVVDVSRLDNVISVDTQAMTALVEPNVSMGKLVDATLAHGLIPKVVVEFPAITVGGAYSGHSGESSSYKQGLFYQTVESIEIVLADGTVSKSSRYSNPDILGHAAESFGTLGVVTLLEVGLMKSMDYVELTYHPVFSSKDAVNKIKETAESIDADFMDGIMFGPDQGVIMKGKLKNRDSLQSDSKLQSFTRPSDPWFYLYTKERYQKRRGSEPFTACIPVRDYLFRYDRNAFWMGVYSFQYFLTPCNRITRRLLDRYMNTKTMFHAFHECNLGTQYICQDLSVPLPNAVEFIEGVDETTNIWPLWLCPILCHKASAVLPRKMTSREEDSVMMLNAGIWGMGSTDLDEFVRKNRKLEDLTHDLGGQKALYAQTFYSQEQFWEVYDREHYESLREKYNASTLPSVYDKVKLRDLKPRKWWQVRPLDGLMGVAKCTLKSDYLFRGR